MWRYKRRVVEKKARTEWTRKYADGHTYGPEHVLDTAKLGKYGHQRTNHRDCPLNPVSMTDKACKCGSTTYNQTNHKDCLLNQYNVTYDTDSDGTDECLCICGSTAHRRTIHRDCPLNPCNKNVIMESDVEELNYGLKLFDKVALPKVDASRYCIRKSKVFASNFTTQSRRVASQHKVITHTANISSQSSNTKAVGRDYLKVLY